MAAGIGLAVAAGAPASGGWPRPASVPGRIPAIAVRAAAPQEVLAADALDGEAVAEDLAARRPLGVIIENFPAARPQWGLSLAARVYEAITEGGITRYLAVFGPNDGDRVGPVRSVRTQFLDYVLELDAALAHVGGNEDALRLIATSHIKDLDAFRDAGPFRRIVKPRLALEHTMFASTAALRRVIDAKGWGGPAVVDHPAWKVDRPLAERPPRQQVSINFSFPEYRVAWQYQPETNDYERILAGTPDADAATGKVVSAKVIFIAAVPRVRGWTRIREETWTFADVGAGRAWIVQDGTATEGQWRKASRTTRLRFVDGTGREVAIDRGPQWVEIVPPEVTPLFDSPTPLRP